MNRQARIDAKAETLYRRTTQLRRLIALEAPDELIARELLLCAQGVVGVSLAMMTAKRDPPPLVDVGQGTSRRKWTPGEENEDGNP